MFRAVTLTFILGAALALPFDVALDDEWDVYKTTYRKAYEADVEVMRRMIWEDNIRLIKQHNFETARGLHSYRLGMNEYGDMTNAEFVATMNGFRQNISKSVCGKYQSPVSLRLSDLPDTVDWTKEGYVTAIKNQGQCGSCWSFSATGSLEGQHFKKTGKLVSLSEKNLMDCSKAEGNMGCKGGLMDQAFDYVIKNNGIDTEQSYPYVPKDGTCKFDAKNVGAVEKSCLDIPKGSEDELQKAVATVGPISVAIDAGHSSFQLYRDGVYDEPRCSSKNLDHGVLAVGYGMEKHFFSTKYYWLVKNSWGESWGMDGYIKMSRNKDNQCGIATQASLPTM